MEITLKNKVKNKKKNCRNIFPYQAGNFSLISMYYLVSIIIVFEKYMFPLHYLIFFLNVLVIMHFSTYFIAITAIYVEGAYKFSKRQ